MEINLPASQASSHFPLEPITGATLFDLETVRRSGLNRKGNCLTGCRELDEEVLLGGFERGCVVGVSAEEEEIGLLLGFQTISHLLAGRREKAPLPRASIITTLSTNALIPTLRGCLEAQIKSSQGDVDQLRSQVMKCLERISISRVFEFEGLWEVLSELDHPPHEPSPWEETPPPNNQEQIHSPEVTQAEEAPAGPRMEIQDSQDEDDLSPPDEDPKVPPGSKSDEVPGPELQAEAFPACGESASTHPNIILITHMSALLTSLFTRREKSTAHTMLQLLSSRLRYLSTSPEHGGPLVLILNSTTTSSPASAEAATGQDSDPNEPPPPHPPIPKSEGREGKSSKPLDATLRSIFNPPPLPVSGLSYAHDTPLSRRNKPSWGLIFTQLLDLHLLCTRVPRTRADAEALVAPSSSAGSSSGLGQGVRYAWVVEVLLDEAGVWDPAEAREGGKARKSREQRWGAVDVVGGKVVDAFERRERVVSELRIAGGFGGLRA